MPPNHKPSERASGIVGYRASNRVTVRIRDVTKVANVIDVLVGAGANEIGGINFTVTQASKLLDEAREKAIADARRKAEIYAKAAGVTLGEPLSISEERRARPAIPRQGGCPDGRRRAGRARRRNAVGDGERVLGDQGGAVISFEPHIPTSSLRSAHSARLEGWSRALVLRDGANAPRSA